MNEMYDCSGCFDGSVAWLSRPMTTTSHPERMKNLNGSGRMKRIPCAGEIDFVQPY